MARSPRWNRDKLSYANDPGSAIWASIGVWNKTQTACRGGRGEEVPVNRPVARASSARQQRLLIAYVTSIC